MNWTQNEINETYQRIQAIAATDNKFREVLLSNPQKAIEELTGKTLPDGYTIKVIESDPAFSATFVLPLSRTGEITDDDLDNIAGGLGYGYVEGCGGQIVK